MVDKDGVVYEVMPLPPLNTAPPLEAAYQSTVTPAATEAEIVMDPEPQIEFPVPVGATGKLFTVAVTAVLDEERHPVELFLASA